MLGDRRPKLVRDARVKAVCAILEGATRRDANLASSIGSKFRRPLGHFQHFVPFDGRMHAIEEFGKNAYFSRIKTLNDWSAHCLYVYVD